MAATEACDCEFQPTVQCSSPGVVAVVVARIPNSSISRHGFYFRGGGSLSLLILSVDPAPATWVCLSENRLRLYY